MWRPRLKLVYVKRRNRFPAAGEGLASVQKHSRAKVWCSVVAATIAVAAPAAAQDAGADAARAAAPAPGSTAAGTHVVRRGDTLWDLAGQYLGDPFLWREIYSVNREVVEDPHWIYPVDRLRIPGLAPRSSGRLPAAVGQTAVGLFAPTGDLAGSEAERTIFFGGPGTQQPTSAVRVAPPEQVPAIPSGVFYGAGIVVPEKEVSAVGSLAEVVSPTVVPRRSPPQVQLYDRVYMRVLGPVAVGERLHLMRVADVVSEYGRLFIATGTARILSISAGVATVEVDGFYDRIELGDVALRMPEFAPRPGAVPQPSSGLDGTLIAVVEGQSLSATEDMAFVNLGTSSGVVEGDEFESYIPAAVAEWGVRPEEVVARLQVIRAERQTSAVRVVGLYQPALEPGLPVRLVATMP